MPYPFAPGEVLTAANLNAALDQRMLASGTSLAFTPGAMLFGSTAGGFQTDATNLFYDNTNDRLGIRTNTPTAMLQVGKVVGTARVYNAHTDTANGEWSYLGDWGKTANVAVYGSDKNGTGIVRDVSFVRGGTEMLRLGASGITSTGGIVYTQSVPVLLGAAALAAAQRQCTVMGHYAYTTNQATTPTDTLEIFDITNPLAPVKVGGLPFPNQGLGNNLVIAGHILYSGCNTGAAGLQMVDVSNPKLPVLLGGGLNVGGQAVQAIAMSGGYLYMGHTTSTTFRIYNISNPSSPTFMSNATMPGANGTRGIVLQGKYAYVTTGQAVAGTGGFYVIDVSDALNPVIVSSTYALQSGGFPLGMAAYGKYLYMNSGSQALIEIIDISDPATPTFVKTFPILAGTGSSPHPIIAGNYLYHFNNTANGIQVFNIADPLNPVSVGTASTVTAAPQGAFLSGNRLYVTGNSQLRIYNTFGVDASSVRAGGLATDSLSVDGASYFAGDIYAQRGLIVGQSGIHSRGPLMCDASDAAIPISAIMGLGLVCFGGQGVSYPALKRSGTAIQVRLGDDSAYGGVEALTLALGGAGAGSLVNPLDIRRDFDGLTTVTLTNASTGAFAQARAIYSNDGSTGQLMLGVMGTLATTFGTFLQDGAYISAEAGLAGGLNLMTRAAAPIRFATNGQANERMQITSTGLITFGGITSAFPALKRVATALEVRLGDDSADAQLVCGLLGVNGQTPAVPIDLRGTFTTPIEAVIVNVAATLASAVTGVQYGSVLQSTFQPSGASLTTATGLEVRALVAGTVAINEIYGVRTYLDMTSYTGANIGLGVGLQVLPPVGGSATKRFGNYIGLHFPAITNGNGVTTGSISNYMIAVNGPTAGAAAGGGVTNYTGFFSVPTGSGAGSTSNYGIYLTGSGGSGGGGTTTNLALWSDSIAPSQLAGGLRIGTGTANPTNATAPHLYIPTCAGVPTGVPLSASAGATAIQYDITTKKLMVFDANTATWKGVAVA